MKYITGFIKRLIKMICAGAFTIIVAACYGVYMNYKDSVNFLFHVKNPEDEPVPGLLVELVAPTETVDYTYTDSLGEVYLCDCYGINSDYAEYTVVVRDIDGPDNLGEFEGFQMVVYGNVETITEYDITVYPVE